MGSSIDLKDEKFGRLTVIHKANNKGKKTNWLCRCDCGNEVEVLTTSLRNNHTLSCGCLQREKVSKGKLKDITDEKYGKLTVIKKVGNKGRRVLWLCKCDCGNEKILTGDNIKYGNTKSCGCLNKESSRDRIIKMNKERKEPSNLTHGKSEDKLYRVFASAKDRCNNQNNKSYKNYGGRGIKLCKEWQKDFINFYDWSIQNGYVEGLTLDRIDNNGNYEPSNCRWATRRQQANNKRNNRHVIYKGQSKTMSEWSKQLNIPVETLYYRLKKGWNIEKVFYKK